MNRILKYTVAIFLLIFVQVSYANDKTSQLKYFDEPLQLKYFIQMCEGEKGAIAKEYCIASMNGFTSGVEFTLMVSSQNYLLNQPTMSVVELKDLFVSWYKDTRKKLHSYQEKTKFDYQNVYLSMFRFFKDSGWIIHVNLLPNSKINKNS